MDKVVLSNSLTTIACSSLVEPNIDTAWKVVREYVGIQGFGDDYSTVPCLEHAIHFNQLGTFVKERKFFDRLFRRRPRYIIQGNLGFLVDQEYSSWTPLFNFDEWTESDSEEINPEFFFYFRSDFEGKKYPDKIIKLYINKCHKRSIKTPEKIMGARVSSDLKKTRKIYVINEVIFATELTIVVTVSGYENKRTFNRIPVAFSYKKYRLSKHLLIVEELPTEIKRNEKKVKWSDPAPLSFLTIPSMSRISIGKRIDGSYPYRRPPKTRLTLQIPQYDDFTNIVNIVTHPTENERRFFQNIVANEVVAERSRTNVEREVEDFGNQIVRQFRLMFRWFVPFHPVIHRDS